MQRIIKRRIKTNIRQAKTNYKLRQFYITLKIIFKGQFSKKSFKHFRKVLLGEPRYTVDKCLIS